jgi:DNA-binding NarL/FixJ family response regulator
MIIRLRANASDGTDPGDGHMPVRVILVEDDARYRASLEQLLRQSAEFQVVSAYSAAWPAVERSEAAAAAGETPPWDLVVMDLQMPQMGGIEATRRLKRADPRQKIVVLTVFEEPATILEAICAGADGYLLKKARAQELRSGLLAVAEGGSALTPAVSRRVLDLVRDMRPGSDAHGAEPARLELTDREQQVLRALVEGLSYKEIADVLSISLGTVRTHITTIYRKLQVHSVAEAIGRAVRQRLV